MMNKMMAITRREAGWCQVSAMVAGTKEDEERGVSREVAEEDQLLSLTAFLGETTETKLLA